MSKKPNGPSKGNTRNDGDKQGDNPPELAAIFGSVRLLSEQLDEIENAIVRAVALLRLMPEQLYLRSGDCPHNKDVAAGLGFFAEDAANLLQRTFNATNDCMMPLLEADARWRKGGAK